MVTESNGCVRRKKQVPYHLAYIVGGIINMNTHLM